MTPGRTRLLLAAALILITGCRQPENTTTGAETPEPSPETTPETTPEMMPTATPTPTPEASPAPLYIPSKRMETARLFNGIQLQTVLSTEPGGASTTELASPGGYALHLDLNVRIPHAVASQDELTALNPELPVLFPSLSQWISSAKISPLYERLYRHKLNYLQQSLVRLDVLLTRHDFYDCETILEIEPAGTKRKMLWIQSDMDVDSDGSDSDRVPGVDANSQTFQPITSYKWPKQGTAPNPFVAERETRLLELQTTLARVVTAAQRQQVMDGIASTQWEIKQLTNNSFLVAATDPYIVIPASVLGQKDDSFSPGIGDYCAVVYGNMIYPAIIGDVGPTSKVGEASLRIAQALNPLATSENRPVSALKVSYLVFPGTAEHPFAPPDLAHWHDRVDALLKEAGGYNGQLFAWIDLTAPPATPTPTPSPSPLPEASPAPSSTLAPSATP
jgi:hypothetical protein